MCRKYTAVSWCLLALGLGLILSCLVGSVFWRLLIGAALVAAGILLPGSCKH